MTEQSSKPVVVAIGNDPFDGALDFAIAEAARGGSGLHLVHVVHVVPSGPELMLDDLADVTLIGRQTLQAAAERAHDLLPGGMVLTTQLVDGPVVSSIVEAVDNARMVVLQHRELGRLMQVVSRSVSSGVAAHAHVPVVSVPADWTPPADDTPATVTVGVDVPARSRAVVAAALAEARARHATLQLLHTWSFPNAYDDIIMSRTQDDTWARRARAEITAVLEGLGDAAAGVPVRIEARHDHAADALVRASGESQLLVVGRHDALIPLGPHLGPVAGAVLREARCPVLVVDPRTLPGPGSPTPASDRLATQRS
ncbi:MAG: Universal stress protein [Nocardioides sp.]|nr:Universal stress protein [Nocardioides sp.]